MTKQMTELAYIFPGQGSQYVGMGKSLPPHSAQARELYRKADEIVGYPLSEVSFDGPEEKLRLRAGQLRPGTMAAVIGLGATAVEELCAEAGVVQCANFNSPGQIVISGSVDGVRRAMELARARGAKLVKELVVSGAFHSELMGSARDEFRSALQSAPISDARIPVYANVSARPVRKADEIRTLLGEQLTSPVRWEESILRMAGDGAKTFVEIGPGKVLQGLVKRIAPTADVRGIDTIEDIPRAVPA